MSNLPDGWIESPLIDLISKDGLFSDGDWVESKDQDPNGAIRLLQLADIGDGKFLNKSKRFVNDNKFELLNCTEVLKGDALVARMPDPLGRVCLMPSLPQKCITVVDVAIVRPGTKSVSTNWLMHFLNSPQVRQEIQLLSSGSTRKRISRSNLSQIVLPIPPVNEQKRIAEKLNRLLERVDACRAHLDRIPLLLKRFRQSVLAAATSGRLTADWREIYKQPKNKLPFEQLIEYEDRELDELPDSWGWYRFADVASIDSNLVDPKEYQDYPHIAPNHIESETGRLLPYGTIASDKVISGKHLFRSGQIIYSKIRPYLCKAIVVDFVGLCSADMYPISGRLVSEDFLHKWMISDLFTAFASSQQGRTVLPKINQVALSKIPVPVPPPEEQAEIVRRVERLFAYGDRLEARYQAARAHIEKLTPALLAQAFRGELVPQDPNDEPASVLLERIRATRAANPKPQRAKRR